MAVCEHCKYRYSWDCDDGLSLPKNGCDSFELDFKTLSNKQQKAIRKILANEHKEEDNDW